LELEVPQDRGGLFHTEVFERYQRSEKALTLAIAESYVQGVSTRKIKKITEQLCGLEISKSQVSRLVERLSEEVEKWRKRKIEKEYRYLVVDARYEHVREEGAVQSCGVLLVVGISAEGYREILGVWCADSESENSWTEVFRDLKERGLRGVKYVVSDNHSGIKAAVDRCFQGAVEQLASTHRKVSEYLDEHGEEILGVYALPEKHRKRMRTTNLLERYNREVKRRTRVIGIFPNRESCIRLVSSMAMEQNEEWMEKRYLTMEEQETDSVPMVS
jgi:transposase-like protein